MDNRSVSSLSSLDIDGRNDFEPTQWSEQLTQQSFFKGREAGYSALPGPRDDDRTRASEGGRPPPINSPSRITPEPSTAFREKTSIQENIRRVRSSKKWRRGIRDWSWELFAWAFATLSIAAVMLLLIVFDERLVSDWESRIGINTMVAVLCQAAVSALLVPVTASISQLKWIWYQNRRDLSDLEAFDHASRGPQGSLRFLFRKHRLFRLASLGALITILMLGFQPFAQQAVNISGFRWEQSQHNATVRRATRFDDAYNAFSGVMSTPMQISGNAKGPSQVSGSCPSTNCTFPEYYSLAFCATIKDETMTITEDCTQEEYTVGISSSGNMLTSSADKTIDFDKYCNFSTQALTKNWQEARVKPSEYGFASPDNNLGLLLINKKDSFWGDESALAHPVVMDGTYLYNQQAPVPADQEWSNLIPPAGKIAARVTIGLCSQKMSTTVVNGTTHTEILEVEDELEFDLTWMEDTHFLTAQAGDGKTRFLVEHNAAVALASYFQEMGFQATGQVTHGYRPVVNPVDGILKFNALTAVAIDLLGADFDSFEFAQAYQNIVNRMNNITASMTNALREQVHDGSNDEVVVGESWMPANFIRVRYRWMAAPLLLWFLASVFFFGTIYSTIKHGVPAWKSSVLALLRLQDEQGASGSVSHITTDARRMKMQLSRNGEAWQLLDLKLGDEKRE
ncbi:hypothetical protein K491DRAFT_674373 [Lophiostoma macrostomum CBS 122681]|uniref:Uncharacterized protein n=1 Tax=Lophiostoma macrostomum CBS 122681 TaxID=1314788 RepID=A0A6A6TM02_9PLEO|nr:hypothetical protein K491DRAFT_674373 [Lophiostoma macrostomum CBS 122681]